MLRNVVFKIMSNQYEMYPESKCGYKGSECKKTANQCIDISVPVDIAPNAEVGMIDMECCGEPEVICCECGKKNVCRLVLVQKVCIKIPVCYSFTTNVGPETIECSKSCGKTEPKEQ